MIPLSASGLNNIRGITDLPIIAGTGREGEAPAEPKPIRKSRLGRSLALPDHVLAL